MSNQALILPFQGVMPRIHPTAFIAPTAVIIGDVEIGADASIWYGCVVRGDINKIRIGARTNIQDNSVVHVAEEGNGTLIGDDVTIGHMALLHGCVIHDHAFIGMKSSVMDDAVVESYGILAAGAQLTPRKVIHADELWTGSPAKFWRKVSEAERKSFADRAGQYVAMSKAYA